MLANSALICGKYISLQCAHFFISDAQIDYIRYLLTGKQEEPVQSQPARAVVGKEAWHSM